MAGRSKPLEFRLKQLKRFDEMIEENKEAWFDALRKDLRKPKLEAELCEVMFTQNEIRHAHSNLSSWMKPEHVKRGLVFAADECYIHREPFGLCLIIGAWNYPLQLALGPLVGAITAGNVAVVKPSELSPATSALIAKLLPQYLDPSCYAVVEGGVIETTELLALRWDHIFYTGSSVVGKIIMTAAAKHLTPVVLELGGKSPAYVDDAVDLYRVARSIVWGRFMNCGQTCVAPDYVLCKPEIKSALIELMKGVMTEFWGSDIQSHPDYCRIVNERHFDRISKLVDSEKVVFGGKMDKKDLFIEPTIMSGVTGNDAVMQEEIFGPVLPILDVSSLEEAIEFIKSRQKPLALYCFTNNKDTRNKFVNETASGGVCVNDVISHLILETLPFGGVGNSGMGGYHGWFSFDCFSHKKSVMVKNLALERAFYMRYPPYDESKLKVAKMMLAKKMGSSIFGTCCVLAVASVAAIALFV